MQIKLKDNLYAEIDDEDAHLVVTRKWYAHKAGKNMYARSRYAPDGSVSPIYMHRLIAQTEKNADTDHIDGNGLNNKRANLRSVTRTINNLNRKQSKGCYYEPRTKKWRAEIWFNKRRIRLGRFPTKKEASETYYKMKSKLINAFEQKGSSP